MTTSRTALRGPLMMITATAVFTCSDTMLKLTMGAIPPFQTLAQRGVASIVICFLVVVLTGNLRLLPRAFEWRVMRRHIFEAGAALIYINALANMPIADVTAIAQTAPMILVLLTVVLYGDRPGALRIGLVALGCLGALLVAQPSGGSGWYALIAFLATVSVALRDAVSRHVPAGIPSPVVVFGSVCTLTVCASVLHMLFEPTVAPDAVQLGLTTSAAMCMTLGQVCIFLAYRQGSPAAVAPFYYCFSIWSVLSGLLVFGTFPNLLALVGMALIAASGVLAILVADRQRRRELGG